MTQGKETCRQLKEIRRQIALANDINFVTEECTFKGECKGTCPKCEAEVRYLESQLRQRQRLGKAVMVAGLSLSVFTANANTSNTIPVTDTLKVDNTQQQQGKYTITGRVVDESGEPMIGASIYDENHDKFVVSNIEGYFTYSTDVLPQKLTAVYIGYDYCEVRVTEKNYQQPISMVMKEDIANLQGEVAIVGAIKPKKHWLPKFLRKKRK